MSVVIDTARNTTAKLDQLKAGGIQTIIRYINPEGTRSEKTVKPPEAHAIAANGMRLGLVCEGWGGTPGHGGIDKQHGIRDGAMCRTYAETIGAPRGATIYFAVDTDMTAGQITYLVLPYFEEVIQKLAGVYEVGVYGSGAVCEAVHTHGLAKHTWLAQSTGWTNFRSYRDSNKWNLLQQMPVTIAGLDTDPDVINQALPDIGDFVPFGELSPTPDVVYTEAWLQDALNRLGADPQLNPDGRIGPLTMNAVMKQIAKDLGGS